MNSVYIESIRLALIALSNLIGDKHTLLDRIQ